MASLYKRATPIQQRILRIVAGAVKNAADSHPRAMIPETFARSVAKRAAGTLSAQWPEVLAASRVALSDQGGGTPTGFPRPRSAYSSQPGKRRRSQVQRPSPLSRLHREIGNRAGAARRAGETDRHDAFVEVLRLIDKELQKFRAATSQAEKAA